jgi:hypothetical protein
MRYILTVALLLLTATLFAAEPPESKPDPAPQPSIPQLFASDADALATIRGYLDRLKVSHETDSTRDHPLVAFAVKKEHTTHSVRVVLDAKRGMVYVFLNGYLRLPNDHPNRDAVLRELMKKNWEMNIGKFEWDPSDGEVRLSYCFTTENGLGYEAFRAIVATLLDAGDGLWPDLKKMIGGD